MTLSSNRIVVIIFCLLFAGVVGCGSNGPKMIPIHGQVTFKGAPLINVTQGIIRYSPKQAGTSAREATGRIQPDGSFVLTTLSKADGVVFGDYDISVSAYSAPMLTREQTESGVPHANRKLMIPEKYLKANTSGLSDTVQPGHPGFKKIELTE